MDKPLILGQLQTVKNNYSLSQAGIALLVSPDARAKVADVFSHLRDSPEMHVICYIDYIFANDSLLRLATGQLRNAVLRNCLKELFEIVKQYGNETRQQEIIEAAPWYQFLRIVRNCLSHDMRLRFRKPDLKHLPATWSSLTVNETMDNMELPMRGFLTRMKALELIDAVIGYVDEKCT